MSDEVVDDLIVGIEGSMGHLVNPVEGMVVRGTSLGHLRKTPKILYGMFNELTRGFYSADIMDLDDASPPLVWNQQPDASQRQVWINTEYIWNDEEVEFRPAIYVSVSDINYSNLPIIGGGSGRTGMDLETATYEYERIGECTIELVHIGLTQTQTLEMVGHTFDLYDAFADVIRMDFCFETFAVTTLRVPRVVEAEDREKFRGSVLLTLKFRETWSLKRETSVLRHVVIKAGLRCAERIELDLQL